MRLGRLTLAIQIDNRLPDKILGGLYEICLQHLGLWELPSWLPSYELDEVVRRLARIGYDGIEIGCAAPACLARLSRQGAPARAQEADGRRGPAGRQPAAGAGRRPRPQPGLAAEGRARGDGQPLWRGGRSRRRSRREARALHRGMAGVRLDARRELCAQRRLPEAHRQARRRARRYHRHRADGGGLQPRSTRRTRRWS